MGLPPTQYTQKEINFLKSLLPHTIFQRLTIFEDQKSKKNKKTSKLLKVLYRLTLSNSQLTKSANDYLNADELYPKIDIMKKESKLFEVFLYERNQQARLSVFMRSKIQENVYFFFTSPLLNLFQAGDFNQQDSLTVIHQDSGPQWKVYPQPGSQKLQTISIASPAENQSLQNTFYQIKHPLKLSGDRRAPARPPPAASRNPTLRCRSNIRSGALPPPLRIQTRSGTIRFRPCAGNGCLRTIPC